MLLCFSLPLPPLLLKIWCPLSSQEMHTHQKHLGFTCSQRLLTSQKLKYHCSQPSLFLTLKSLILLRTLSSWTLRPTGSPHTPVTETFSGPSFPNLYEPTPLPTSQLPCLESCIRLQSLPLPSSLNIIRKQISPVQKFTKHLTSCPGIQGPGKSVP